jgi:NAD-dependent DNA ligase
MSVKNLYSDKVENLEEMDKFLVTYDIPKLSQEDINKLNRTKMNNETEAVIKVFPTRKSPELSRFTGVLPDL